MLRNFNEETCNLSDDELKIAQAVMKGLKKYVGKANAMTDTYTKFKLQGVRLRKIINHLRNEGEPICSSSKGYYYPASNKEITDTCISIQQRIDSQVQIINQLTKHI